MTQSKMTRKMYLQYVCTKAGVYGSLCTNVKNIVNGEELSFSWFIGNKLEGRSNCQNSIYLFSEKKAQI